MCADRSCCGLMRTAIMMTLNSQIVVRLMNKGYNATDECVAFKAPSFECLPQTTFVLFFAAGSEIHA